MGRMVLTASGGMTAIYFAGMLAIHMTFLAEPLGLIGGVLIGRALIIADAG